jgi:hypothetical protein
LLDRAQVSDHGVRIVNAELDLRHVGMASGDAALEQAWKLIKIETSAERSKRRGTRVSTFADASDRMTAPAEFREQRSAVKNWILRTRSGTGRSQPGEQREDHRQPFHRDIFVKRKWRAGRDSNP